MSYLLDKKIKRKIFSRVVFFAVVLFVLFYFRSGILSGLAYGSHKLFRPVLIRGNNLSEKFSKAGSFFISKNSLADENENLKLELSQAQALMLNYNSVLAENAGLKEILGRKSEKRFMTLAAILGKPSQNLYNTLIIDAGTKEGIGEGDIVFALGNIPLGRIAAAYPHSSKVVLFSSAGEKTQAIIAPGRGSDSLDETGRHIFGEAVGRGGGNFEMIIPRDLTLSKGDQAVLPGLTPYVLGIVETIISDPRDLFIKALLVSPANIQELKFVQVEVRK